MTESSAQRIIRASWIGIIANAVLAALKIVTGIVAGSFAVISDGVDSGNDILTSIITLVTAYIAMRPPDVRFPYGYRRADTIASKVLSFVIFFAGAQLVISSASHLITGSRPPVPSEIAFYVTGISIASKIVLAAYKTRVGRRERSSMLVANGKNMQNDVLISVAVLVGLALTHITGIPQLDSITALVVSLWIIKVAFDIFMSSNTELMDGLNNTRIYNQIFDAVACVEGASHPHRVRARQLGSLYSVVLDIEVDRNMNVAEAHRIAQETERVIRERVQNIYDIVVHVEPEGNVERTERYGVSEESMRGCKDPDERDSDERDSAE